MANVLLVDDNSKYLKDALPFYGYDVEAVNDGFEALKALSSKNKKFDIMLLDVMMPNMDGWQTLNAVRSSADTKNLPVIMLTAVNEDQKMVSGLKNGADDYIVKPFILPNLLARMEAVLRRTHRENKIIENEYKKISLTPLTAREKEVLNLASQGCSNKEIADKLVVREVTIKSHMNTIFKKLKVMNRTQAVLAFMQSR